MKDCIIITSIVEIGNAPMDWVSTRSIYSYSQRFEQTIETIESIRKYMPNTDILLIECSPESEYMSELKKRVDIFVNAYPNDTVINCFNKSIGEATLLTKALSILETMSYNHIYKITGRYVLTEKFNKNNWSDNNVNGIATKHYSSLRNPGVCMHTFFYKIPSDKMLIMKKSLQMFVETNSQIPIEHFLYSIFQSSITHIPEIGIQVRWSCFDCIEHF
jgi:hypothetical protein